MADEDIPACHKPLSQQKCFTQTTASWQRCVKMRATLLLLLHHLLAANSPSDCSQALAVGTPTPQHTPQAVPQAPRPSSASALPWDVPRAPGVTACCKGEAALVPVSSAGLKPEQPELLTPALP